MLDAEELAAALTRHGADIIHCTPSRLAAYLGRPAFAEAVRGVKAILSAGEVLPSGLVAALKNNYGIRIYNGYGPTEATIGVTITEAGDELSIGRPIGNTGVLLLNRHGKPTPLGALGEICIYGDGVGLGYHLREEETREKFIERQGLRCYRTGDLGHINEDGRLIYHGRNDRQIKLRGLRIELSEIERVMASCPGLVQANCLVKKFGKTEQLVGFYTVKSGETVEQEVLRALLKKSLAAYMVPDILKELDALPQTPGGKTDLRALAALPLELERVYRAPETAVQEHICEAFEAVLHGGRVGLDDNFFELGGDSLGCVDLMLEIEKRLRESEARLDFTDIYRYPTPALLAERLAGEAEEVPEYELDTLDYGGMDGLLTLNSDAPVEGRSLGTVLLTGATGYLGVHILVELLKNEGLCDKVYCLARSNKRLSAEKRVKNALFYYAEEDFGEDYGRRWEVVEGDISQSPVTGAPLGHIDTIINSAANVAHFAYGDALTKINIGGVRNLIGLALENDALLCQISTISVGGVYRGSSDKTFTEADLYIGQHIYNEYIYTKFMAEHALCRAAVDRGLRFKVLRVGNLQGRSRDGEFQMNMKSNAFTRQLSSYIKMGRAPASVYGSTVNFSPIDDTARVIVALAAASCAQRVFHVYPPEEASFETMFAILKRLGHEVSPMDDGDFDAELDRLKHTEEGRELVEGLLTERPGGSYRFYPVSQLATERVLEALGVDWTPLSDEYLEKYLQALGELDMF